MAESNDLNQLSTASLQNNALFQQNFLSGYAPTLVMAPSNIPLCPGYQTMVGPNGQLMVNSMPSQSAGNIVKKYNQLLAVIEEMKRDLRPMYVGSRSSTERFKRGITQCRVLIREILHESESSSR